METIILSIIIFGVLVIFHEFGHFSIAKLIGVKVEEFAVGMGPKIFGIKKGETLYSLRALPLGGFCKMLGEDEESKDEKSLSNKSILGRGAVFIAGSLMNILLAIILLSIVFFSMGTPSTSIAEVEKDYPAYSGGIRPGDKIININDQNIKEYSQIETIITENESKDLEITIERDEETKTITITPKYDENLNRYRIGIRPASEKSLVGSIINSIKEIFYLTKSIMTLLGQLVTGRINAGSLELVGPIGVVAIVNQTAKNGILPVILLAAQISLNLGIFNLLPIPALDGSRLLFLAFEGIRGKPVNPEKEGLFHFVGFVLLMILAVFIGYKDIIRFKNFF
ncbi:MAG TPA: RIP metalloprotease RseP [Eubacteriaceae bacterium]|jgi:regulator of sigma E protease|nr:RIP metalloprotease RseP [Eubacteriaceae bacterium]